MNALKRSGNGIRRMAAFVCMLAFSLGPMPLLPMLFAWTAGMEGSHAVLIDSVTDGGTRVVLRHGQGEAFGNSTFGFTHRHGMVSRMFCLVAHSPGTTGDHIATFTGLGAAEDDSKGPRVQPRSLDCEKSAVVAAANQERCLSDPLGSPGVYAGSSGLDSLSMSARQRCLRSMCLLI